MDEDFESLIVTNPELVDPGIDVSGLRTQTDTSLLGSIPDFAGIQYEAFNPRRLSDLMKLYSYGLPAIDTSAATVLPMPTTPIVRDGGQANLPFMDVDSPKNTPEQQRLIDAGIGVQAEPGAPVSAPGEGMLTQEAIDDLADYPINTEYKSPYATGDANVAEQFYAKQRADKARADEQAAINREQYMTGEYTPTETYAGTGDPDLLNLAGGEAGGADAVGIIDEVEPYRDDIMDMVEQPQTDSILAGDAMGRPDTGLEDDFLDLIGAKQETPQVVDVAAAKAAIAKAKEKEQALLDSQPKSFTGEPQPVRTILGPDGIIYDAVTGQPIDFSAPGTLADPLEKIDVVTEQDLVDDRNLLQKLGLPANFDVKQAALEAGINLAVGTPITLLARGLGIGLDALGNIIPSGISATTNKAREVGLLVGDTTVTQDKYGINTQSQFGDYDQYNIDRVKQLEDIVADQRSRGKKNTIQMKELADRKNYLKASGADGDIDEDPTGDAQIAEETIGTLPEITEARQEQGEYIQEIEQQKAVDTTTQRGRDEADRQKEETGVAKVETDQGTRYETGSGDRYASAEEAAEKGDGPSGGGGGKIVCTMMNESYGFGSFRNKIWMKFHKDLSPEYQKGYHKLFLPLVKIAKKNIIVKKVLEHIAVHSTIDMRQSMRGKTHLLGRVYRKILLPLCYWVGKNG
jgi:hypothetical protein